MFLGLWWIMGCGWWSEEPRSVPASPEPRAAERGPSEGVRSERSDDAEGAVDEPRAAVSGEGEAPSEGEPEVVRASAAEAAERWGERGTLVRASEGGGRFTPCGSEQTWTLSDPKGLLPGAAMTDGTPAYAELHLSGARDQPVVDAVAFSDPSGVTRGCARPARVGWWARGNEPFWSLDERSDHTTWATPEEQIRLGPLHREEEAFVARGEGDLVAVMHLRPLRCTDDMSGEILSHHAEVRFQGQVWRGCAAAPLSPSHRWPRRGPVEPGPEHPGPSAD